jgi:hypothetical protein
MTYQPTTAFEAFYYGESGPLPDDFVARVHAGVPEPQFSGLVSEHDARMEQDPTSLALSVLWEGVCSQAMTIEQACELSGTTYETLNNAWQSAGWSPLFPTVFGVPEEPVETGLPARVFP